MSVIALGFFDGVHIGHAALLKRASELSESSAALTFDMRPELLTKGIRQPLITTNSERERLLRQYVSQVLTLHFDESFMHIGWQDFISGILIERYKARHVVAGHDFHFGYKGEGTPERLSTECRRLGIGCDIIPEVHIDGIRVSSTYIRGLLSRGDMENAAKYLGRCYSLSGTVEHGRKLGTKIGSPTVNIPLAEELQMPAFGVYLTNTVVNGTTLPSVTNVGVRPTVEQGARPTAETTILDFNGDLYGAYIRVEFLKFIREERRFESVESLKEQIQSDMNAARELHGKIS